MSEYWVSQAKHHCDFCKCWIADNKPSRDYHEKGKKHKENVQRKISEIHKKTKENAKKEQEMNSYFKEMEENALKAAKRDIENDPSLARLYGVRVKEKEEPETIVEGPQMPDKIDDQKEEEEDVNAPENWDEDTTPEGYTYYWNLTTRESRWVPPDGYIPKAESDKNDISKRVEDNEKTSHEAISEAVEDTKSVETEPKDVNIEAARGLKRKHEEDSVNIRIEDVSAIPLPGTIPIDEPLLKITSEQQEEEEEIEERRPASIAHPSAYGQWAKVQEPVIEPPVDLQLPVTANVVEEVKVIKAEAKIKFREKVVPSLAKANAPPVFFKKKKGIGYKNLKQRTDDL